VEKVRARETGEGGDFLFQRLVRRQVAADQMRGAAAGAPAQRAIGQRLGDPALPARPR
jgi:hypothetical protein